MSSTSNHSPCKCPVVDWGGNELVVYDIAIDSKKTSKDAVIFSYLPKNVKWNAPLAPAKKRIVVCQEMPFQPVNTVQSVDESRSLFYSVVDVPVNVYAQRTNPKVDTIYCGWLESVDSSSWKVLHSDSIPFL